MTPIKECEKARLQLQERLDGAKTQVDRNQLGQFCTPAKLAAEIVTYALSLVSPLTKGGRKGDRLSRRAAVTRCVTARRPAGETTPTSSPLARGRALLAPRRQIRFLEPGFGTGPFYSALLQALPSCHIEAAVGYEIDPRYAEPAKELWKATGLRLHTGDFTMAEPPKVESEKFNLVVCNPPYIRHHHLSQTQRFPPLLRGEIVDWGADKRPQHSQEDWSNSSRSFCYQTRLGYRL